MSKPSVDTLQIDLRQGRKIYFASDFHLGSPSYEATREREARVVAWLEEAKRDMGALFLLGDIFDYWFEYRYVMPKGNIRLLGKLAELSDLDIPVFFFWGNHDAWTRDLFEKELGMKVCKSLAKITVNGEAVTKGTAVLLTGHGDGLGPGQGSYKGMKKVFNAPLARALFASLHPYWAHTIATRFSRHNRKSALEKAEKNEERLRKRDLWLKCFINDFCRDKKVDGYVFAHSHRPVLETLENGSVYANTGDWLHHDSYVTFDGQALALNYYKK